MKYMKSLRTWCVFLFLSLSVFLFAQETSFPNLYRYTLENGLELFVAEDDSAPLAYIELAVRAGAVTQTPETAGLFHLYEHMLFKGNSKYASQTEFTEAENKMGAIDENGSTGIDRVNYFFTVPSSQVKNGLEFWSYALRTPNLDKTELENEKAVVLSEINADFTDPAHIRSAALSKHLFPEGAWRLDPGGEPSVVKTATTGDLRAMQKQYYVPENSAIFVGGDVHHEEIYRYVKSIYGDWKNPREEPPAFPQASKNPLAFLGGDLKLVHVTPGTSDGVTSVVYYVRGPDGEFDAKDTYAADVLVNLLNNPSGDFATSLVSNKKLSIPNTDYVGLSYPTRRASGILGFYAYVLNQDGGSPVQKAEEFLRTLKNDVVPLITSDSFYEKNSISSVIKQLEDSRVYELESAKAILSSLSFFWSACGADYFFSYDENIARVTKNDVISFVHDYITDKKGILLVRVSPSVWEAYKTEFIKNGFQEITAENAFWMNDKTEEIQK